MRWLVAILAAGCSPASSTPCDRMVTNLEVHLQAGAILWFGEVHGTVESPRFVGDVVCHASGMMRVQLGLEVPAAEQPRIDAFLRSDGGAPARTALLDGAFWNVRDGRSSEAMLALLDRVRALRKAGRNIDIVAFDGHARDRDEAMANVVAGVRDPKAIFVGLSGNIHSRLTPDTSTTLVGYLGGRGLGLTTFDVSANGGSMWACMSLTRDGEVTCGVHQRKTSNPGEAWTLGLPRDESHDGTYHVGTMTASPPARAAR
jgi:hypothetical protein